MIRKIQQFIGEIIGKDIGEIRESDKPAFGDYSANVAFLLAKEQKKSPLVIAQELARAMVQKDSGSMFVKIEAVAPGFINFWLKSEFIKKELAEILKFKNLGDKISKKKKIQVEFISANPTGPLTMANGRGGFLGDVLGKVLETAGNKVQREYYINDAGNQIKLLGESIFAALGKLPFKEDYYQGEYIGGLAKRVLKKISKRAVAEKVGRLVAQDLLREIKLSVKNAGIRFDNWFSENQKLRRGGLIEKVLAILEKKNLVAEHDGAKWLKSSEIADEKDRVLVKSNGEPTYFLSDIAYHYDKFVKRRFDEVIDVWGADHHGYVSRLKAGIKAVGLDPNNLKIIITQMVRLVKAGEEVKMSKRKGEFITLDELLKEVGRDAARFFFLMHSPGSHMDFDLDLAKERSMKNPVYYVQYAYVRLKSILKKSKIKNPKAKSLNFERLCMESELALIKELIKFPDVILQTAEDYEVSRLTRYAMEVARSVHNFYENERVIGADFELMIARLNLVAAAKRILGKLFQIIGIDAPEKM